MALRRMFLLTGVLAGCVTFLAVYVCGLTDSMQDMLQTGSRAAISGVVIVALSLLIGRIVEWVVVPGTPNSAHHATLADSALASDAVEGIAEFDAPDPETASSTDTDSLSSSS